MFDGWNLLTAATRGVHLAGLLSTFGALSYWLLILRPVLRQRSDSHFNTLEWRMSWLVNASLAIALVSSTLWFILVAVEISGADRVREVIAIMPTVTGQTHFGRMMTVRLGTLAATALAFHLRRRWSIAPATVLAAMATLVQAELGHPAAVGDGSGTLLVAGMMHVGAAGLWLGGLLPLFLTVRDAPLAVAANVARRFSSLGTAAVLMLGGSGLLLGARFVGGLHGLISTDYGHIVLCKLMLFATLLLLAAANRYLFSPRLAARSAEQARLWFCYFVGLEIGSGTIVLLAAGLLASLPPAAEAMPVWASPILRPEVAVSIAMLAAVVGTGHIWRRRRRNGRRADKAAAASP